MNFKFDLKANTFPAITLILAVASFILSFIVLGIVFSIIAVGSFFYVNR